jgi:NAD+ synthase (glutamine-hydrolysing)
MVYENGTLLAESRRFASEPQITYADLDLDRLVADRMRQGSFGQSARPPCAGDDPLPQHRVLAAAAAARGAAAEGGGALPVCAVGPADARCPLRGGLSHPGAGLATRMRARGIQKLVIGVSGGLDSTQALLVCARAMDELGLSRRNILAYTLPGFATSTRTRSTAWQLMRTIGATAEEIDIRPSCLQMLKDLRHPFREGPQALRRHVRERAGRGAHEPPVPASPTRTADSWSGPATFRSSRSGGAPTASATRCRTTR